MTVFTIPMSPEQSASAKAEVSHLSDEAVVYMLSLAILAVGLAIPEHSGPEGLKARRVAAAISTLLTDKGPVPANEEIQEWAKQYVTSLFSLMPSAPN